MRGDADPAFQPRQPQFGADARRQPRIGRGVARPHALVQTRQHHHVRRLQPRLDQAVDSEPRMPLVRAGADRHLIHQQSQQRDEPGGGHPTRAMLRLFLQRGQQVGGRAPGRAAPRRLARQPVRRLAQARDQPRQRRRRVAEGRADRLQERAHRLPPRQRGGADRALPLRRVAQVAVDPVQPRRRARPAQRTIQPPHRVQPRTPLRPASHQRMLQQRQQRHRREILRRRLDDRGQQRARRQDRQRPPRAVVHIDVPPAAMRRYAPRQRTVGGDQRRGPPRLLQRLAQDQRHRLCLLGRIGQLRRLHPGQAAPRRIQPRPFRGEGGRGQRIGDRPPARRRRVMLARIAPARHLAARHAHPFQQQFQVELRMHLDRAAAQPRRGIGCVRPQRLPFLLGQ